MLLTRRIKIVLNKNKKLIGSFSFPNCGIILLKGENGCGKSTLLRATLGFKPFKGKLYCNGTRLHSAKSFALLRQKTAYVSPVVINDFIGYTFNEILEFYKETEDYIELQKIIKLPLNTKYELLSSGELVKFHLLYSLLLSPTNIYIDDSLASLSSEAVSQCSKFFKKYSENHLIVICSHKELPEIEFDKVITIDKNTIFDPRFNLSTEIKRDNTNKKSSVSCLPKKVFFNFAKLLSLVIFLFTSLIFNTKFFDAGYKEYKNYVNNTSYFYQNTCNKTVSPCDRNSDDFYYHTIRTTTSNDTTISFIVLDKPYSISYNALNSFIGSNINVKLKDAKHYFSTYFNIKLSGNIIYDTDDYIVTIKKDDLESLYDNLTFMGLYVTDNFEKIDIYNPTYFNKTINEVSKEEILSILNSSEVLSYPTHGIQHPYYPAVFYNKDKDINLGLKSDYLYNAGTYFPNRKQMVTIPHYIITTANGLEYFKSLDCDLHSNSMYENMTIITSDISKYINKVNGPRMDFDQNRFLIFFALQFSLVVLLLIEEIFSSKIKSTLELRNGMTCTKYTLKEYLNVLVYEVLPSLVFYALGILLVACLRIEFSPLITLVPLPFVLIIPFLSLLIKTILSLKKIK